MAIDFRSRVEGYKGSKPIEPWDKWTWQAWLGAVPVPALDSRLAPYSIKDDAAMCAWLFEKPYRLVRLKLLRAVMLDVGLQALALGHSLPSPQVLGATAWAKLYKGLGANGYRLEVKEGCKGSPCPPRAKPVPPIGVVGGGGPPLRSLLREGQS